ncbi:hypothetical protein LTR97_006179 [Elasticomyces elasticus]|uniref:Uncharacterized protein n=1 Tax=Elasticomyces elasticus TaxID=574655 RepID=A0AAN7VRQ8_9PEZI|nr:hypothetical protein LTR97_006179 [Elasticomyces elasticus]
MSPISIAKGASLGNPTSFAVALTTYRPLLSSATSSIAAAKSRIDRGNCVLEVQLMAFLIIVAQCAGSDERRRDQILFRAAPVAVVLDDELWTPFVILLQSLAGGDDLACRVMGDSTAWNIGSGYKGEEDGASIAETVGYEFGVVETAFEDLHLLAIGNAGDESEEF